MVSATAALNADNQAPTGGAALLPGLNSGSLLISAAVSHCGIALTGRDR
jgi:hypothetical protein